MSKIMAYISTPPNKLVYRSGEKFDSTGMKVTCEYQDDNLKVTKYLIDNTKEFLFDYKVFNDNDYELIFYILFGSNLIKLKLNVIVIGSHGKYDIQAKPCYGCEYMVESLESGCSEVYDLAMVSCLIKPEYEFIGWYNEPEAIVETSTDIPFIFSTDKNITYYVRAKKIL